MMEVRRTNYFAEVLRRERKRILRNRTLLFVSFIGPLLAFFLIAWIFSANVPRELPVAVVDHDHTAMSRQISRMVDATSIANVNRDFVSLDEAHKQMKEGKIDAIVYIPQGSEKDILKGGSTKIALYINNINVLKGGMLNSGIRKAIGTYSAGVKLQVSLKSGMTQEQAMARIMPVQLDQILLFNPFTSYSYYLSAALIPLILVLFVMMSTVLAVGDELYQGTGPQWIRAGGGHFITALMAKLFPYTVIFSCIAIVMDVILFYSLGMPLKGNFGLLFLGELMLIVSYQSLSVMIVALTSNMRLSLSLGSAYVMLALTYSGLTFPAYGMAPFSQAITMFFPFTYWTKLLISQSLRGEPMVNALMPMISLTIFILFGLLFIPLLRQVMLNRRRWGKI
jgi:ABC-2 type transport system permease protein